MKAAALALVLVASPLLAGCLGAGDEPVDPSQTKGNASDLPLALPDNRTGDFAAFRETNLTDDYGHHNHDYWLGRSRAVIFAGHLEMSPFPSGDGATAVFRPPPGGSNLVYEGTGSIEVVVKNPQRHACYPLLNWNGRPICTDHTQTGTPATGEIKGPGIPDPAPSTALRLEFLHAASGPDEWVDAGALAWDTPTVIAVKDPTWTDMPHSSGSLWAFRIISSDPKDVTLTFDIEATAVRSAKEIPKWPGHPVFYTPEKRYRVVYDGAAKTTSAPPIEGTSVELAGPSKLVSAGTRALIVSVNVSRIEGQAPGVLPSHLFLYYHNASYTTWNITNPFDANYTTDKSSFQWVLRVDPNGMDSPYATASRWEFMVRASFTTPVVDAGPAGQHGLACYDGCYGYTIDYTMTIVATDLEPPAYSQSRRG